MKKNETKCKHDWDDVIQTPNDKPWEGYCSKCKKRVMLKAVPND